MKSGGQRPVAKVLLVVALALALLWLILSVVGCGARQARIVMPDGKEVMCETYNVTSEGAVRCGNAADRQQLIAFCIASMEHAKLDMCKTVGADRAPSDSPKEVGRYYYNFGRRGGGSYDCYMMNLRGECIPWKR